jgi:hypothetical protein
MNRDEMGNIIHRMMRDLEEDNVGSQGVPRCEGCGQRVELAPYQLRASNGSAEWVMYCAACRELAAVVDAEGHTS